MRPPRVSIRWVLIGANALTLATPLLWVFGLRAYDVTLMRETEEKLAAEAVVIAEMWRASVPGDHAGEEAVRVLPPGTAEAVSPWEPQISQSTVVAEPLSAEILAHGSPPSSVIAASARLTNALRHARAFNLSGARVVDAQGMVVASSNPNELGAKMAAVPEVQRALSGAYAVEVRRREDRPSAPSLSKLGGDDKQKLPPLGSISRRGRVVVFVAIPVFADGRVVGAVRMARTSVSTLEHLWKNRKDLLLLFAICTACMLLVSLLSYRAVVLPISRVTRRAREVADGSKVGPIKTDDWSTTEAYELGTSIEHMREQLQSRADYAVRFVADATHELRTPLTAIAGATELLHDNWANMSDERRLQFLRNMQQDTKRMGTLVGRLLALARIENAAAEITPPVAVRPFFEMLQRHYHQVEFFITDAPEYIDLPGDQLDSAVRNLLDNALRHGTQVQIHVGRHGERLRVLVRDDGPGVPEEHQTRIFDRYYTTERDRGGSGLGLAIVRAVAESRGGSVRLLQNAHPTCFELIL